MRININSDRDIDYTILNGRMAKAEKQKINLVDDIIINLYLEQNLLNEEDVEHIHYLVKRKNKYEDVKSNNTRTKTGAFINQLSKIYSLGLTTQQGYTLVEMDLSTCMLQVIQIISGLNKHNNEDFNQDISHLREKLGDLFSGTIDTDSDAVELIESLIDLDNKFLNAYIDKAFRLSKTKEIITVDMFNVERTYRNLFPLEALSIPITYSLNTLHYVIIEELRNVYRRGEKRFAGIDKCRIYYFVRNDVVDKFTSTDFIVDGVKLDIKCYKKKPLRIEQPQTV